MDGTSTEWARCVENSHYFPYGSEKGKYKGQGLTSEDLSTQPSWNQQQSLTARDKIAAAIGDLLNQERLPTGSTARFKLLTTNYHIGGSSLYRHRDLWHPDHLEKSPPDPPTSQDTLSWDSASSASHERVTSLLCKIGCNALPSKDFSDLTLPDLDMAGRNSPPVKTPSDRDDEIAAKSSTSEDLKGPQFVQQLLFEIKGQREEKQRERMSALLAKDGVDKQSKTRKCETTLVKMQRFLKSGDRILVNEAIAWARDNPGLIDIYTIGEK